MTKRTPEELQAIANRMRDRALLRRYIMELKGCAATGYFDLARTIAGHIGTLLEKYHNGDRM